MKYYTAIKRNGPRIQETARMNLRCIVMLRERKQPQKVGYSIAPFIAHSGNGKVWVRGSKGRDLLQGAQENLEG